MQISTSEKNCLIEIIKEDACLNYPKKEIEIDGFDNELEYVIPQNDKVKVLSDLWPFSDAVPSLDEEFFDIHSGEPFKVGDFRVIDVHFEDRQFPMLACPQYNVSGGTILDWQDVDKKTKNQFSREFR